MRVVVRSWGCAPRRRGRPGGGQKCARQPMMLGTRPSTPGAATAEALSANLEQMKSVEQLRRVYRDLKDLKNPDSN